MRIHLLGLPNTSTTAAYCLDGFAQMTMRTADLLMRLGHEVILYTGEENEAPCTEWVTCITKAEQAEIIGSFPYQNAVIAPDNPLWQIANPRMIEEIGRRKQPRDLIFTIGGYSQKPITDAHLDLMDVEYSIGYVGNYARYRVFESRVWQHYCYGAQSINQVRFFDDVIPVTYNPDHFPEGSNGGYVVYCGRLVPRKGVKIACDAAQAAGVRLKVVGHGDPNLVTYGEYLGPLDNAARNAVLANANAVLCPTVYLEPFNCVAVEAQMCGTPVICTDQGGFVETVEQGVSGWRATYHGEFVRAIEDVMMGRTLDREVVRNRAQIRYGLETGMRAYDAYLRRLALLWDQGWNTR